MEELIEDFKKARLAFVRALDDFPEDRRKEALFNEWGLRDLIAHMSGWMVSATNNVKFLKRGKTPPWVESINEFNKENVERRKNWSWEKAYKELVKASGEFIKEYESLPEELWEKKYWSKRNFTPKRILEIEVKHWRNTHLPQIAKFVEPKS